MDELTTQKAEWFDMNMKIAKLQKELQDEIKILNDLGAKIQKQEASTEE